MDDDVNGARGDRWSGDRGRAEHRLVRLQRPLSGREDRVLGRRDELHSGGDHVLAPT